MLMLHLNKAGEGSAFGLNVLEGCEIPEGMPFEETP